MHEDLGKDACELVVLEGPIGSSAGRTARQPASPILFTEPVAHLGRATGNVDAQQEADAADGFAVVLQRERGLQLHGTHEIQVVEAVAPGVGMGKLISQIARYVGIIGVPHQRRQIVPVPRAHPQIAELQLHSIPCSRRRVRRASSFAPVKHPSRAIGASLSAAS